MNRSNSMCSNNPKVASAQQTTEEVVDLENEYSTKEILSDTVTYKTLRPIVVSLRILGMFYEPACIFDKATGKWTIDVYNSSCERSKLKIYKTRWRLSKYYAIFLAVFWLINSVRSAIPLISMDFNVKLLLDFITVAWLIQTAINRALFVWKTEREFLGFFVLVDQEIGVCKNRIMNVAKLQKWSKIGAVVTWVIVVLNTLFLVIQLPYGIMDPKPVAWPWENMPAVVYVLFILSIYPVGCWTICNATVLIIAQVCYELFYMFNESFEKYLATESQYTAEKIFKWQTTYDSLCKILMEVDSLFNGFIGFNLTFEVVLLCVMSYTILWNRSIHQSPIMLGVICFWLVGYVLQIIIQLLCCIRVYEVTGKATSLLHGINLRKCLDSTAVTQVTLFLSRTIFERPGISLLSIFIVNKTTIVTIIGAVVTYLVLLIQFNPNSSPSHTTGPSTVLPTTIFSSMNSTIGT